jgi:signal transduction histidine kinase/streptogramin lyase
MIKKLTFTILLALASSIGFAQLPKIPFEKYGVAEGLPEEVAITPLQDDKGFIWFGTQNGLVKYDGYRFKVYKQALDKTDTNSFQIRNLGGGLLKARNGKIWIAEVGGAGGISSFDPLTEKFRIFYPNKSNSKSTDESYSILLFEDETGNIWFSNRSGLNDQFNTCRLNPKTGVIKRYSVAKMNSGNRFLTKYGIIESSGAVWLLDDKKNLNRLNPQKDSFEIIIPSGKNLLLSGNADTLRQLSKASANRLLLTGTHGLSVFDSKNQKIIKSYVHTPANPTGLPDSIFLAFEDFKGQIWVTHQQGKISLIDPASGNIQIFTYGSSSLPFQKGIKEILNFFPIHNNKDGIWFQAISKDRRQMFFVYYHFAKKTFSLYDYNFNLRNNPLPSFPSRYFSLVDRTGLLWLGTRPSLYKQAPKKQQMDLFRYRADEPNGLPSDSIRYLFEDSKKRLWIATRNGLAIYQPGQDNFRVFRNDPANPASLSDNRIALVQEDADGKIWVGTANGLNLWQESSNRFKRFFYTTAEVNDIEFLFPDKQHRLWLSIYNKGVFVLDKNTGRVLKSFLPDDKNPASLSSKQIDLFYQDSKGTIWLGDRADNKFGLYRLNSTEDGFKHYMPIPGDSSSISSNEISFINEDGKKRLWIGTDGGLNSYDYSRNKFTRFISPELNSVNYFATDQEGTPWFGTYSSGGLVTVNAETGIITSYGETKGLLQNDITSGLNGLIAKDNSGQFWLPTQRGLSVFDPETKSFTSYFEKDGFQPYDRFYVSIKTSNGDIWIGSSNGLNHILPANLLKKDTTVPSIVITQMSINDSLYSKPDGTIFKQSVAYTKDIELKYWQKNLSFDFVALHYLRSEDNLYSWKLENYDKNWSAPSKERKVSYTNLSPGKYIFRVKASNADGVWNEEGISITIRILPPWWKTWWAYTIYALLFLGALRIFSKWRERRLRHEKEVLELKVNHRTQQLQESIESLKSTQSQLVQSEKMASLGELTAGIAHEIQNPLNFVNNFSEVSNELIDEMKTEFKKGDTEEGFAIADDIKQNLEKILHHGKRADAIVKGMLQHSRSSNGVKEPTDINALADEYLRLAYHGLRAKDKSFNATLKTDFDESIGKIDIIPPDIGRVILNLITNAFYAVDEKKKTQTLQGFEKYEPTVSVRTRKTINAVELLVTDNGNGIPQKILDKIFQPFFTTKPTGEGTGLGLSLSYDIVKVHGGELKVESEVDSSTGKPAFTNFTITLPILNKL